jgi:asparagine synthase (glutamine-hydrolysing)
MCGIAGFLTNRSTSKEEMSQTVSKMAAVMSHRGPDDDGVWVGDGVAFGHQRLSVVDGAGASQPMVGHSGCVITYNGEIYNYVELREELEAKGHRFKTQSDTEVLLKSYEVYGADCLEKFIGMFAFAIWNPNDNTLFVARDRLGKKPMYFYNQNGIFAFASEIKGLIAHPEIEKNINLDFRSLSDFLTLGYILSPKSIYREIFQLPPANQAVVNKAGLRFVPKQYWHLEECFRQPKLHGEEACLEELISLLKDAVRIRLRADNPVGVLLSGGLDSSISTFMANEGAAFTPEAFTVGFSDQRFDESKWAAMAAKEIGVPLTAYEMKTPTLADVADKLRITDQPFADTSMFPMFEVCRIAQEKAKVVLSGDGADEVFAGYPTYLANAYHRYFRILPVSVQELIYQSAKLVARPRNGSIGWDFKVRKFFSSRGLSAREAHYHWRSFYSEAEKQDAFTDHVLSEIGNYQPFDTFDRYFDMVAGADFLDQCSFVDIKTWLHDDILVKTDRMSMANSVELRSPFLDHRVVEFAARLSVTMKLNKTSGKHILKELGNQILPGEIVARKKSGFNAPTHEMGSDRFSSTGIENIFRKDFVMDQVGDKESLRGFVAAVSNSWFGQIYKGVS